MSRMFRALALLLVLTFAAGTVAHAAQASGMAVAMSVAADAGAMPDCEGCGGDDDEDAGKLACSPACVAPGVAVLGTDPAVLETTASRSPLPPARQVAGQPTVVDPYPPRSNVLI